MKQNDAIGALYQLDCVCQLHDAYEGNLDNLINTIRAALEQAQRAQQIVDLMEQGNDIAFVSELHGEFIYRTQHSLVTQQDHGAIRDLSEALAEAEDFMSDRAPAWQYTIVATALTTHAEAIKRAGGE